MRIDYCNHGHKFTNVVVRVESTPRALSKNAFESEIVLKTVQEPVVVCERCGISVEHWNRRDRP
jgi:hypothetical protein